MSLTLRIALKFTGLAVLLLLLLWGCDEKITGEFNPNLPPETEIFLSSEDTLNYTQSVQTIYWDGSDPDGFVTGFYYTFTENPAAADWTWTSERFGVFPLALSGTDTIYRFQVKAVDNHGAEDPSPARQLFPIINSPPTLRWATGSSLPDTTFTVANFSWVAADPDGDATIDHFEYSLDDTSNWIELPGTRRSLNLNESQGIVPGEHAFYLRVVDIAGAKSSILRMPEDPSRNWYAKAPQGRYLLIDDFEAETNTVGRPDAYYRGMLTEVLTPLGESFTYWNIEEQFPSSTVQFTETLKLFDRVIWYTDLIEVSDEHFIAAQIAIPQFRANGGKLILTVQFNRNFGQQGDPLAFSPVDSLGRSFNFILTNSAYNPDPAFANAFPGLPPLPALSVSSIIVGSIALKPKANSIPMYRYDDPAGTDDPLFILTGQNDNTGEYDFIFSGTPLHYLRGNGNLNEFFTIVLRDFFGQ